MTGISLRTQGSGRIPEDSAAFRAWTQEFRRRCQVNGWFSNAELPSVVADLIERGDVAIPDVVELAGFHELTPSQQRLVDALAGRGVKVRHREIPDEAGDATRVGLADASREIRASAEWARRMLENEPDASAPTFQIGIIVPDLNELRSEIERVFGEVFHLRIRLQPDLDPTRLFNISLGLPLDEYPIIKTAFLILGTDPLNVPVELASRIMRSPFLHGAEEEMTNRALLDVSLRSLGRPEVSLTDISVLSRDNDAALWCPFLVSLFGTWTDQYRNLQTPRMPSDWAPVLSGFLQDIGWPGDRVLDSIEYQTLEVWNELLSELARLDCVSGRIPLDAAVGILGDLASSRLFQTRDSASAGPDTWRVRNRWPAIRPALDHGNARRGVACGSRPRSLPAVSLAAAFRHAWLVTGAGTGVHPDAHGPPLVECANHRRQLSRTGRRFRSQGQPALRIFTGNFGRRPGASPYTRIRGTTTKLFHDRNTGGPQWTTDSGCGVQGRNLPVHASGRMSIQGLCRTASWSHVRRMSRNPV